MGQHTDVLILGAGIFGLTAALELRRRGLRVSVLDRGPIPHPEASSNDISKVVRMDYGTDAFYTEMAREAIAGWKRWNEELLDEPLFHEVGVLLLNSMPMSPHSYEYESYQTLQRQGVPLERLHDDDIARRYPAWRKGVYVDGYLNPQGGYAESGRVLVRLASVAAQEGVTLIPDLPDPALWHENGRVAGVRTPRGETFRAGHTVVAAGAWTPILVPALAPVMRAVGQPIFHLQPADPSPFRPPQFVTFTADVSHTGWYGFPWHERSRVLKIANHGVGRRVNPADGERVVTVDDIHFLRAFLRESLPILAEAPIVYTRLCLYCDTLDEHFWIDRHPETAGLTVAAGGSGHAFKFAPLLGGLVADAVEGRPHRFGERFRWRELAANTQGGEAARSRQERTTRMRVRGVVRQRDDHRA
jgi:glycine/D-amino acid oxidase-like deaminating enzyme